MSKPQNIGSEIIDYIGRAGLLRVSFATKDGVDLDDPAVVFVWAANAPEQIEALVKERTGTQATTVDPMEP